MVWNCFFVWMHEFEGGIELVQWFLSSANVLPLDKSVGLQVLNFDMRSAVS